MAYGVWLSVWSMWCELCGVCGEVYALWAVSTGGSCRQSGLDQSRRRDRVVVLVVCLVADLGLVFCLMLGSGLVAWQRLGGGVAAAWWWLGSG